jgi:hypothetical protein
VARPGALIAIRWVRTPPTRSGASSRKRRRTRARADARLLWVSDPFSGRCGRSWAKRRCPAGAEHPGSVQVRPVGCDKRMPEPTRRGQRALSRPKLGEPVPTGGWSRCAGLRVVEESGWEDAARGALVDRLGYPTDRWLGQGLRALTHPPGRSLSARRPAAGGGLARPPRWWPCRGGWRRCTTYAGPREARGATRPPRARWRARRLVRRAIRCQLA